MVHWWRLVLVLVGVLGIVPALRAAGTLTPAGATEAPIQIVDHHVNVGIGNGFATTEVIQTFFNPNATDVEAIYAFPLPVSASLSEVTITIGETEIRGEVLAKSDAEVIFEEEKAQGNDAGLASKDEYRTFEFRVTPVRAQGRTRVRFLYYQPLEIDSGIARYLYPLAEGGTDDAGASFWLQNAKVEGTFSVHATIESTWPVTEVRVPGFEQQAAVQRVSDGEFTIDLQTQGMDLARDFVLYYRLADDLPGRMEVIAHRADPTRPGTFMLVVTPGIDLVPLTQGADYVFVLDVSGSMETKIRTLTRGVAKVLGEMRPEDRLRVITFADAAAEVTRGFVAATPENVRWAAERVEQLRSGGSTNLHAGLELALEDLDDDRATSIVLVTDGVANTGTVTPAAFHALMKKHDVRVFGFLMGNSANWPLMRTICDASGGFHACVSNDDDILGQILLAKSKVLHECLHDVSLKFSGVKVFDTNVDQWRKIYRGQQLVIFGRYDGAGSARVSLKARLTGVDETYETEFDFPEQDADHPELERLWALSRIEQIELSQDTGEIPEGEASTAIRDLGIAYQLVTDETSMVVLSDDGFAKRGIERRNRERVAREEEARARRAQQPVANRRADSRKPAFSGRAPSLGGGAVDPFTGALMLGIAGALATAVRRRGRPQ